VSPLALRLAAALAIGLGVFHSVLGERYILIRLFRRDLPKLFGSDLFTKRTLRFAWHLTTLAWLGLAAVLLAVASGPPAPGPRFFSDLVAIIALASAAVAAVGSRGRHLSWVVFLAIGGLAWWGGR
jgi:hypothetical protein